MVSDTEYTEKAYYTSEVATMLDMAVPTIRKYAQTLERKGYVFLKTQNTKKQQSRLFVNKDITVLRYLKDIRSKGNTTVEQASSIVIERFGKGAIQGISGRDTDGIERYSKQYTNDDIVKMMEKHNELIKGLTDKLDQQQQYIDKRLEERDKLLLDSMNKSLETQKQIAATQKEEKKGNWSRLCT